MALVSGSENALGPANTSWHGLSLAPTSDTPKMIQSMIHGKIVRSQVNKFSIVVTDERTIIGQHPMAWKERFKEEEKKRDVIFDLSLFYLCESGELAKNIVLRVLVLISNCSIRKR